jgi:tetratricopeptide (TPR) repeat protein
MHKKDNGVSLKRFSTSELKEFDGKEGRSAYVAFKGKIYDVTNSSFWKEALAESKKAELIAGDMPYVLGHFGAVLALSGQTDEALKMLTRLMELSKKMYVSPLHEAWIYNGFGEKDLAFEYLEKAYLERDPMLLNITGPWYDSLRGDPKFKALLEKMGLD